MSVEDVASMMVASSTLRSASWVRREVHDWGFKVDEITQFFSVTVVQVP